MTRAICDVLRLDPLRLISSGAMLITASDADPVLAALRAAEIPAAVVGTMTVRTRLVRREGRAEPLAPPDRDELWRVLSA